MNLILLVFIGIFELNNDWLWWFYAIFKYDNVENCGTKQEKERFVQK